MRRRYSLFFLIPLLFSILNSTIVHAHDARPIVINIYQTENLNATVHFRLPDSFDPRFRPAVNLPEVCTKVSETLIQAVQSGYPYQHSYRCSEALSGHTIMIVFPSMNPSLSSLIKFTFSTGEVTTKLLPPGKYAWMVPKEASFSSVAIDYTVLGMKHIWQGVDHLFFILCLLLMAGSLWLTVKTITGFTIGHSISLALSALGAVQVSVGAVEVLIALSIVYLAAEIIRNNRQSLAWRYPVAISIGFGLLHGLGFASVLSEIGLPQLYELHALFAFNVGVEVGQVAFIGLFWLAGLFIFQPVARRHPDMSGLGQKFAIYAIGLVSAVWFLDRSVGVFFA